MFWIFHGKVYTSLETLEFALNRELYHVKLCLFYPDIFYFILNTYFSTPNSKENTIKNDKNN